VTEFAEAKLVETPAPNGPPFVACDVAETNVWLPEPDASSSSNTLSEGIAPAVKLVALARVITSTVAARIGADIPSDAAMTMAVAESASRANMVLS
jgi:hypothetical protein